MAWLLGGRQKYMNLPGWISEPLEKEMAAHSTVLA